MCATAWNVLHAAARACVYAILKTVHIQTWQNCFPTVLCARLCNVFMSRHILSTHKVYMVHIIMLKVYGLSGDASR